MHLIRAFRTIPLEVFKRSLGALLFLLVIAAPCAAQVTVEHKRVLIMFQGESTLEAQVIVEKALRSTLKDSSSVPIEIYAEYLDSARTDVSVYESELVSLLKKRYADKHFDLIIAVTHTPLKLLLKNRTELFPGTPIVYLTHDRRNIADLDVPSDVTGVWGEISFKPNLDLSLALHPGTKKVVVVSGVSDWDKYWLARAREDFRAYESGLEFTYLIGHTSSELKAELASLSPNTVVVFITNVLDKAGNTYENIDVIREISPTASAPIYGTTDAQVGAGIVGGRVVSFQMLGEEAAHVGLRILAGEKPASIPPHEIPGRPMFDWRQLQRWGISESSLPEGSDVRFKQSTVWEQYKWYAIGLIAVIILEALLIGLLLYLRIRRRQAEAEATKLNSRITEIVANVPGIVWETRTDPATKQRKTTFISDYVQMLLGYTPDEWMKQPPGFGFRIVADEDREQAKRDSQFVMETGQGNVSEFRWRAKDGRFRWIQNYLIPIKENGNVVGMRGVALDVTNRKLAEEQANRTEEKDKALLSALPDMMFLQSLSGDYLDYHASDLDKLLVPPESFLGKNVRDILPPDLARQFLDCFERSEEGAAPQILEYKLDIDGIERWYEARMVRTGDKILSVVREVTERVLARTALQESEARFRNMSDTAPVMIWIADENKQATYVNKQFTEFTGGSFELEMGEGWTRHIHPDDIESFREAIDIAYQNHDRFETEFRRRRSDGEYRWVFSSGTPRFSPGGEFLGYIGTSIDITERMESEKRLREANQELRELKNQLEAENIYLQEELRRDQAFGDIVGESAAIKYVLFKIGQVAPTDSTVLITGETGTGKELVAHAIHDNSLRKGHPFVKVNCAALSPSLIESELFGHEKGSFTGAAGRKIGRFELANGGTLLLDEIGELPLELQAKLLRVLQEGEFERVGGTVTNKTNVRVIASTNRDLKREVEKGMFRQDLWYRLNVFPITTPPLRERRDDIPLLTNHFVRLFASKLGKPIEAVAPDSMAQLCSYSWPGNVRELANVIERAVINSPGKVLRIREDYSVSPTETVDVKVKTLEELEREHIRQVLGDHNWRIDGPNGAARILGLNPSTLRSRIAKLDIRKPPGQTSANSA